MSASFVVVLTTLPSRPKACALAEKIIRRKLAACVNVLGPAESFFWWQGKMDRAKEYLLVIKTRASHFASLEKFLEKNHPYSVPEILALPVARGNSSYLNWLKASVR